MKTIYIVVGNHRSLRGCCETIEIITAAIGQSSLYRAALSFAIVPNEINLIIEETSKAFAKEQLRVSEQYPDTIYILFITEYLTRKFGMLHLNTFTNGEAFVQSLFSLLIHLRLAYDEITPLSSHNLLFRIACSIRLAFAKAIRKLGLLLLSQDFWNKHEMLSRRMHYLASTKHLYKLCISTTPSVLRGYSQYLGCDTAIVPILINQDAFLSKAMHRAVSKKLLNAAVFTGRLSGFRKSIIQRHNLEYSRSYPLYHEFLRSCDLQTYPDCIKSIAIAHAFGIIYCLNSIHDIDQLQHVPIFEIYVPQSLRWPFSSPNRTYLSLKNGFIPINIGHFDDHPLCRISLEAQTLNDVQSFQENITEIGFAETIKNFALRLKEYNGLQLNQCHSLAQAITKVTVY